MKNRQINPDLKIKLRVPSLLLQDFDKAILGNFPSRNEAIRRGMTLVIEEIKQLDGSHHEGCSASSEFKTSSKNELAVQSVKAGRD